MEIKVYTLAKHQGLEVPVRVRDSDSGDQFTCRVKKGIRFFGLASVWDRWVEAGLLRCIGKLDAFLLTHDADTMMQMKVQLRTITSGFPEQKTIVKAVGDRLEELIFGTKREIAPEAKPVLREVEPAKQADRFVEKPEDALPPEAPAEEEEDEAAEADDAADALVSDALGDDELEELADEDAPAALPIPPAPEPEPEAEPEVDPKIRSAVGYTKKWLKGLGIAYESDELFDAVAKNGIAVLTYIREQAFRGETRKGVMLVRPDFDGDEMAGAAVDEYVEDAWLEHGPDDSVFPVEADVVAAAAFVIARMPALVTEPEPEPEPKDPAWEPSELVKAIYALPSATQLGKKGKTALMQIARDLGLSIGGKGKAKLLIAIKELRDEHDDDVQRWTTIQAD